MIWVTYIEGFYKIQLLLHLVINWIWPIVDFRLQMFRFTDLKFLCWNSLKIKLLYIIVFTIPSSLEFQYVYAILGAGNPVDGSTYEKL